MPTVLGFTVTYTVVLFFYGQSVDSPLTGLYTGINIGLIILFAILHRMARWSNLALWAASLVGLGNMFGGVLLVGGQPLYMRDVLGPIGYDKVYHFAAATGMSLIAWEAVKRWSGGGHHPAGVVLLTWLVVNGGGAVVEVAEFFGSRISGVSVGDYANNALDLLANALGASLGVALLVAASRRKPRGAATVARARSG